MSRAPVPCCCLCLCHTSMDHRRQKKLRNDVCAEARQVLESLSGPHPLHLMLRDSSAVLCSSCHRNLGMIAKLDKQLALQKANIMALTSAVQQHTQSYSAQKRTSTVILHPPGQSKHMWIEADTVWISSLIPLTNIPQPTPES